MATDEHLRHRAAAGAVDHDAGYAPAVASFELAPTPGLQEISASVVERGVPVKLGAGVRAMRVWPVHVASSSPQNPATKLHSGGFLTRI